MNNHLLTIHGIVYTEGFNNNQWLTIHYIANMERSNEQSMADNSCYTGFPAASLKKLGEN